MRFSTYKIRQDTQGLSILVVVYSAPDVKILHTINNRSFETLNVLYEQAETIPLATTKSLMAIPHVFDAKVLDKLLGCGKFDGIVKICLHLDNSISFSIIETTNPIQKFELISQPSSLHKLVNKIVNAENTPYKTAFKSITSHHKWYPQHFTPPPVYDISKLKELDYTVLLALLNGITDIHSISEHGKFTQRQTNYLIQKLYKHFALNSKIELINLIQSNPQITHSLRSKLFD